MLLDERPGLYGWVGIGLASGGVAVLSPLAYMLVLTALAVAPVSAVAPTREVSVVLGVLLGSRVLAERDLAPRLASATAIALGIVVITIT
ncbi:MAG TPA: hypothetical protein VF015_11945 [Acidimicrobiales bacterium]